MSILDRFKLDGKTAVVTGCNRGLGKAMAVALAEAGVDIFGVSRSLAANGSKVQCEVEQLGRRSTGLRFERNEWLYLGTRTPTWMYGGTAVDKLEEPRAGAAELARKRLHPEHPHSPAAAPSWVPRRPGRWQLVLLNGPDARSQLVFLQTAMAQFRAPSVAER